MFEITKNEGIKEIEQQQPDIVRQAQVIEVKNEEQAGAAACFLVNIKTVLRKIESERAKIIDPLNESMKSARNFFKNISDPLETAEINIKRKISDYRVEQERMRQAEERRLQEETRRREAAERKRLLDQAAKAEAAGKMEKAEEKLEQAEQVFIPMPVVAPYAENTHKITGGSTSGSKDIEISIIDALTVCKAVAAGTLPVHCIEIKTGEIKRFVKATNNRNIPGVSVRDTFVTRTRVS